METAQNKVQADRYGIRIDGEYKVLLCSSLFYFRIPRSRWQERIDALAPYQVTQALMDNAGPQCRFMHCLPAYHDHKTKVGKEMGEKFGREAMEVTDEVFESPASIVFDEAENRMHTIKAVMYELMK